MRNKLSVLALAIVVLLGAAGCSSFNRAWQRAGQAPVPTGNLAGRWQGTWLSEVNGHTDQLRCLVAPEPDGSFRARFHAKYRKIFSFGYTVRLNVRTNDQRFAFEGEANLGWYAGGLYHYTGWAESTNFHATYSCKYDHGTFDLTRVQ